MTINIPPAKPKFELLDFTYSPNPSKNYFYQLLAHDIENLNPGRALDAGCGELRNWWMFPGDYVGISHNYKAYFRGLRRATKGPKKPTSPPRVYLTRLEGDFSFIGGVDLCVCSNTMLYIKDKKATLARFQKNIKSGGALLIDDDIGELDNYLSFVTGQFARIDVVFFGYEGCDVIDDQMAQDEIISLTKMEMLVGNDREGHSRFYLKATGKVGQAGPFSPTPELVEDNGLFIVKSDIPFLKMDDESAAPSDESA